MCGTMPSVQPNAATTLMRPPREKPVASVYSAPVPGEATTISEVSRNSMVMIAAPSIARLHIGQPDPRVARHQPAAGAYRTAAGVIADHLALRLRLRAGNPRLDLRAIDRLDLAARHPTEFAR